MFQPWVTDYWGNPENALGGLRLMVLGESHYGPGLDSNFTRWFVEEYLRGDAHGTGFLTKVGSLIDPHAASINPSWAGERTALWASLMFYNFVPVSVGATREQRPDDNMWDLGVPHFREVLKQHQPEAVLVLGKKLWYKMPWSDEQPAPTFIFRGAPQQFRRYFTDPDQVEAPRVVAAFVDHPTGSWGWSADNWHEVVSHLFDEAERERARCGIPPIRRAPPVATFGP